MTNADLVVPIVQNVYIVGKKLTKEDIMLFLAALRNGDAQLRDVLTKKHTLIRLLEGEGFLLDEPEDNSTALKHDRENIEVYLSREGVRDTSVTIAAGKSEYGMHPTYLEGLIRALEGAGFKVKEVPDAKRIYTDRPYVWETSPGREMLAGAKGKGYIIP